MNTDVPKDFVLNSKSVVKRPEHQNVHKFGREVGCLNLSLSFQSRKLLSLLSGRITPQFTETFTSRQNKSSGIYSCCLQIVSYIDIMTGHASSSPLGKGRAGNMPHDLLWRPKFSPVNIDFSLNWGLINLRLPLNFRDRQQLKHWAAGLHLLQEVYPMTPLMVRART